MKNKVLYSLLLFLVLFNPQFLKINTNHFLGFLSIIIIIVKGVKGQIKLKLKQEVVAIYLLYIVISFLGITHLNNLYSISSILNSFSSVYHILFNVIPFGFLLTNSMIKKDYQMKDFIQVVIIASFYQSLISLFAFLFPTFQNQIINMMLRSGEDELISILSKHRLYGYATGLTFSTPIILSFVSILSLFYFIYYKQKINGLFFLTTAFSAIINARVALIVLFIGVILLLYKFKSKVFIPLIIILSLITMSLPIIMKTYPNQLNWIIDGYNETYNFIFHRETTGIFAYLFDYKNWRIPEGNKILFGYGKRVMSTEILGFKSDVGYINDLWYGGIVYIIINSLIYFLVLFRIKKDRSIESQFVFVFSIIVLLVTNIKGYVFTYNNFTTFLFITYLFSLYSKKARFDAS